MQEYKPVGIENVAPEIIRKTEVDNLLLLTNEEEKILSYYEQNSNDASKEVKQKIKKYLKNENRKRTICT